MLRIVLSLLIPALCFPMAVFGLSPGESAPAPQVLPPGYGALNFKPPAPGTYRLPELGPAADGTVLRASGEPARLYDLFDGKLVLLSFIYTTCSDVAGCPLATAVFHRMSKALAEHPELRGKLRLVSLSFDPQHDTPAVMRHYGSGFRGDGTDWQFVTTASQDALRPILEAYGQSVVKEYDDKGQPTGSFSHILRVFLIDRDKRIRNIYSVSFLHPQVLINDVKTVLLDENAAPPSATVATESASPFTRAGDDKAGYASQDYRTHSLSLPGRVGRETDLLRFVERPPLGLPPVPVPQDNPVTRNKVDLGRKLFFDRRLSLNDTISCAMCHIPEQGFTNNELATSVGFEGRTVRRNAPTVLNAAYKKRLFHDGRETTLERQIWQPMTAPNEMANPSIGTVIEKLERIPDYRGLFQAAFAGKGASMETVGMAIASYERTLLAADSPFDRWYYGKQEGAVDAAAKRGFALFTGKAGCAACHTVGKEYALFTDNTLHNTGLGWHEAMQKEPPARKVQLAPGVFVDVPRAVIDSVSSGRPSDLGLYEVSQNPADRWRYMTPSLRNVALTAPYMHNGAFGTLEEVVDFYDRGGYANELLDPRIRPLGLSAEEKRDLVAFLRSLTGSNVDTLVADAFAAPVGDLTDQDPHWSHENRIPY